MEADDFFAYEVQVGGPVVLELLLLLGVVAAIADGADVVDERVEPDVDGVLLVAGYGNAPAYAGAGEGEVFKSAGDVGGAELRLADFGSLRDVAAEEAEHLIAPDFGLDFELVALNEIDELTLVSREAEEVVLFGDGLGGSAVGADGAGRAFDEHLLAYGVLAGVGTEVDGVAVAEELEELLDGGFVVGVGGADVVVVGDAHAVPEGAEGGGDLVGELLGREAGSGGGALDLLAVFIGAGEEEGVVAEEAVATGDDVGRNRRVRVADVGARVDIVNRGGEVELFCVFGHGVANF